MVLLLVFYGKYQLHLTITITPTHCTKEAFQQPVLNFLFSPPPQYFKQKIAAKNVNVFHFIYILCLLSNLQFRCEYRCFFDRDQGWWFVFGLPKKKSYPGIRICSHWTAEPPLRLSFELQLYFLLDNVYQYHDEIFHILLLSVVFSKVLISQLHVSRVLLFFFQGLAERAVVVVVFIVVIV